MPKRIVDGEGLWRSCKLGTVSPPWVRSEYACLIPLASSNGVFECDPYRIWSLVYSLNRPDIDVDCVSCILDTLSEAGLLFRWTATDGKVWGYFVGIDKPGRLPGESRRGKHEFAGPAPNSVNLGRYVQTHGKNSGFVYFIAGRLTGKIKIGFSKTPVQRMNLHQCGSPDELVLLALLPAERSMEGQLHRRFSKYRLHGEWFDNSPEILKFIEEKAVSEDDIVENSETVHSIMESIDDEDGNKELLGLGVGLGIGLGNGVGAESQDSAEDDMNNDNKPTRVFKQISVVFLEVMGIQAEPLDLSGGVRRKMLRDLTAVYGASNVLDAAREFAESRKGQALNYPIQEFLKVADGLLRGVISVKENPDQVQLEARLYTLGEHPFVGESQQKLRILVKEFSADELVAAYGEFIAERDDFSMKFAPRDFVAAAPAIIKARRDRAENEQRTRELYEKTSERRRVEVDADFARLQREQEIGDQDLKETFGV